MRELTLLPWLFCLSCTMGSSPGADLATMPPGADLAMPPPGADLAMPSGCVTDGAQIDCAKLCANVAANLMGCSPFAPGSDCLARCAEAKGYAPRLLGCALTSTSCSDRGSCTARCAQREGDACQPARGRSCEGAGVALWCDARTRSCKQALMACARDTDCPDGLVCFNDATKGCARSCADDTGRPLDLFCQTGKHCDPATFLCTN